MTALTLVFLALSLPALMACAYLLGLTLLSGQPEAPPRSSRRMRFDLIVPAHDEAAAIAGVVANLRALHWPSARFRVVVVADNCSDATAAVARDAGALVIERDDPTRRGKGHALAVGFQASLAQRWAHAVVVIDADSLVSPNLLEACASRIERGAMAVQVHHGVRNPQDAWRTRLMAIALGCFHRVRSRGRARLGLSSGLRGNGWCVPLRTLRRLPYRAYTLAEDVEYGIDLGLAGIAVEYADEAEVVATMVVQAAAAQSQRRRWEDGRWELLRTRLGPLLKAAWSRRSLVAVDLAFDLLVLPLSYLVLALGLMIGVAALVAHWQPAAQTWLWFGLAGAVALLLHVLRGWQLSGVGLRGLVDLLRAPPYVVWKLVLMLRPHDKAEWVRTRRETS